MANQPYKPKKDSFFNLHFTSTLSISLVLYMVGLITFLGLFTKKLSDSTKENISISLVLRNDASKSEITRIQKFLTDAGYAKAYTYISKEDALKEHTKAMGEDPTQLLGYNPLKASIEVSLNAKYANNDSISLIEDKISTFKGIHEVAYPKDLINLLNKNVQRISLILMAVALILLFISIALINNTIRLSIYAQRFAINTMKLVGAKASFIRAPFIKRNIYNGFIGAIIALVFLFGSIYYFQNEIGESLNIMQFDVLFPVAIVTCVVSLIITFFSALFSVNRFLRMKTNDLYFI